MRYADGTAKSGDNPAHGCDLHLSGCITDKVNVSVRETGRHQYAIRLENLPMTLPMEVATSEGVRRIMVSGQETTIRSSSKPVIDPNVYYLMMVTFPLTK